jgi:hypothetical protein
LVEGDEAPLVEALLAAPAGVALLARLEAEHRPDVAWFDSFSDSDPDAVAEAARSVGTMSFGRLVMLAVEAAENLARPWQGDAPGPLVRCLPPGGGQATNHRGGRRPLRSPPARLRRPRGPMLRNWGSEPVARLYCPVDDAAEQRFSQLYGPHHPAGVTYGAMRAWPTLWAGAAWLAVTVAIGLQLVRWRRHKRSFTAPWNRGTRDCLQHPGPV